MSFKTNITVLLLAVFFLSLNSQALNVYSQLYSAQAENRASDYSTKARGRFWFNTASEDLRFSDTTTNRILVTTTNTQTLTNKTIDADSNTVTNIENADIKSGAAIARSKIASGTASHVVINDGSGNLSSEATLAVSRGGTNIASYATGDLLIASESAILSKLPIGSTGQVLKVAAGKPSWGSAATSSAVVAKTSADDPYTALSTDDFISVATSGSSGDTFNLNLPAAASNSGKIFEIKKTDSDSDSITIDPNGAETIDGSSTLTINGQYQSLRIISDASNWHTLNRKVLSHNSVVLSGTNGFGSTDTTIRRFAAQTTVGTAITYGDSAANGTTLTINEPGLYSMVYTDARSGGVGDHGISLNSSQRTTAIQSISAADILCITHNASTGNVASCTAVHRLAASDIIRAHGDASQGSASVFFRIHKIAD